MSDRPYEMRPVFSIRCYKMIKKVMMAESSGYSNGKIYREKEEEGDGVQPQGVRRVQKTVCSAVDFKRY